METADYLEKLFHPKSIAVIEAAKNREWQISGTIQRFGKENLYLVSQKEEEIRGIKCYREITELPDKIDHAIIAVNRKKLKSVIQKCIEKQFYTLHIFTAGGAEFDEEGREIEREVYELIKTSKTRAIGPNCMGIYSPDGKITYDPRFPEKRGNVGVVSHSGDLTTQFVLRSASYGVFFSKVASIGNSIDLKIADFIRYFDEDKATEIIIVYFEGFSQFDTQDGLKLWDALKYVQKPLLFLRGGTTKQGKRAAASHTGSIATNDAIWNAVYKQTMAQQIDTFEDLIYSTMAFNLCKGLYPKVKSVVLIGWSGGKLVLSTDQLNYYGIELPEIQPETQEKMKKMISIGSIRNPLDLPWIVRREKFPEICKLAIEEEYIGGVFLETAAWEILGDPFYKYLENLIKIQQYAREMSKPFLISLPESPFFEQREKFKNLLLEKNIPVFPTLQNAAKAFVHLYDFQQKRRLFTK
ncbi:MAG: CoA-binding protein [Candidatus Helarchaeota archaeon]